MPQLLKNIKVKQPEKRGPVWKGPESNDNQGGISFSALSRWLSCRERFRLYAIEGLKQIDRFDHKIFYGSMWHQGEETFAKYKSKDGGLALKAAITEMQSYAQKSAQQYRFDQEEINKWYQIAIRQFPEYVKYWEHHPEVVQRTPIAQEMTFKVPYELPSGRTVYLRGKMDGVDLIGQGKSAGIYLFETKSKGKVEELMVQNQMAMDAQTMLYLVALNRIRDIGVLDGDPMFDSLLHKSDVPTRGVRYNIIRRPLSGGKGMIIQKKGSKNIKPETKEEYWNRVAEYIKAEPETYFYRWSVQVSEKDLERFKRCTLNPILEQLCDWYVWVTQHEDPFHPYEMHDGQCCPHWISPRGWRDSVGSGYDTEYDNYLENGSEMGLTRVDNLFMELT